MKCPSDIMQSLIAELLERGEMSTFQVHGSSMHPTIKDGEVVTVQGRKHARMSPGDIVLFRRGDRLCVHRVAAFERDGHGRIMGLRTTGDGLGGPDGVCPIADVLGVVVEVRGSDGTWHPQESGRRALGRVRSFLTAHPRVRVFARTVKRLAIGGPMVREEGGSGASQSR